MAKLDNKYSAMVLHWSYEAKNEGHTKGQTHAQDTVVVGTLQKA